MRKPGEGPTRIGEALPLDEDIYSMLFVLCVRPEQHFYYHYIKGNEKYDFAPPKEEDGAAADGDIFTKFKARLPDQLFENKDNIKKFTKEMA